jgi:hypothetical protein
MIQDTSFQNEMYLASFSDDRCGGWGIQPPRDDCDLNPLDPDCLGTASVFWAVSVPAESPWQAAENSRMDSSAHALPLPAHQLTSVLASFPVHQSSQPHKFPVPGAPHIGVRVKVSYLNFRLRASLMHTRYMTMLM